MTAYSLDLVGNASCCPVPSSSDYWSFVRFAENQPLLGEEEERVLFGRLRGLGDLSAASRLVLSHLRLVISIAREYAGYGLPKEDLIQEGNVGLMKAVRGFNPEFGTRLSSYAKLWIKAEIQEFVLSNWRIVKLGASKSLRKLFFNLRSMQEKLHGRSRLDQKKEVAELLGVQEDDVATAVEWFASPESSLDSPVGGEGEDSLRLSDFLVSSELRPDEEVEKQEREEALPVVLEKALASLGEREALVIRERRLTESPATLGDLAGRLGVSIERVRQIEASALAKMRSVIVADGRLALPAA